MNDILRYLKKIAALLLVLVMVFEFLPSSAFAFGTDTEGEVFEVRSLESEALQEEGPKEAPEEGTRSGATLTATCGDFTVTVENAPEGASLSVSEATGYDDLIQPFLATEYLVYFALDISLGDIRPAEDMTVTVEGDPLINATTTAKLLHIKSGVAQVVGGYTLLGNKVTFTIPANGDDLFSPFIFAESTWHVVRNLMLNWGFEWVNGGGGAGENYEYTDLAQHNLRFHPQRWIMGDYTNTSVTLQSANVVIKMNVAGAKDDWLPVGSVRFELPAHVFYSWNGTGVDSVVTQLPKAPNTNDESVFNWYTDEATGKIIVTNHSPINGGTNFAAEFSYEVDPLDVDGGYPDEAAAEAQGFVPKTTFSDDEFDAGVTSGGSDIDRFCWNRNGVYLWKDFYHHDIECRVTVDDEGDGVLDKDETNSDLSVEMMTRAGGYVYSDPQSDENNGIYMAWQNTWGTTTDEPDEYFYIVWDVEYGRLGSRAATQPWEIYTAYENDFEAIKIGDKTFKGTYVGMLRTSGLNYGIPNRDRDYRDYYMIDGGAYSNIGIRNNRHFVFATTGFSDGRYQQTGYSSNEGESSGKTASEHFPGVYFAVLVKYPMQEVLVACHEINPATGEPYVDLVNDGLVIRGMFDVTEEWEAKTKESNEQSRYTIVRKSPAQNRLFLRDGSGEGVFYKEKYRSNNPGDYIRGAQTVLDDGLVLDVLSTTFDGYTRYPWHFCYDGTSSTNRASIKGQHIILEEDQMMMSSANALHSQGWQPNSSTPNAYPTGTGRDGDGNVFLVGDEGDYILTGFNIVKFSEYNGTYAAGVWKTNASPSTAYSTYEPIYVYVRLKGAEDFVPYCVTIKDPNHWWSYGNNDFVIPYRWNGEMNEDGTPVRGAEIGTSNRHIILPANTVDIKFVHDSSFYRTHLDVAITVKIYPTEKVQDQIRHDMYYVNGSGLSAPCQTYLKNIASFKVYDRDTGAKDGDYTGTPRLSGDSYAPGNAIDVIWKLTAVNSSLTVTKSSSVPADSNAAQQAAALQSKEIAYIKLHATNSVQASQEIVGATDVEDRYKLISGVFYDLLPKGTSVQEGSVFGAYNQQYSSHQGSAASYPSLAPHKFAGRDTYDGHTYYFLTEDDFSVQTEYIEDLDQYMLIIEYSFPDPKLSHPGDTWECYMDFYFILENSFQNIRARGTSTENYVGFENTLKDEDGNMIGGGKTVEASRVTKLPASIRAPFKEIADRNPVSGFGSCSIKWNTVTVIQSGFTKMVAAPETLNGLPQNKDFDSDGGRVTVGNRYVYRIQYTTEESTRSKDIVIYDIFESGTLDANGQPGETSYWKGKFQSVDIDAIKNTPCDGQATNVKCAPEVYYSTTLTERVGLGQDWTDLTNEDIWTKTCPDDPSTVTAIAIDCRKATNNADFHLGGKTTLTAYVNMVAPSELPDPDDPDLPAINAALVSAMDFRNVPGDIHTVPVEQMSRTSILLRDTDVSLVKNSDPDGHIDGTVTDDKRCQVKPDGTGTIVYRLTLRNTMPFDCNDIVVTDPIPAGLSFDKVTVRLNGALTESDGDSTLGFRYELADDGRSFTFYIDQQHPTVLGEDEDGNTTVVTDKDTSIYIYTTVDELKDAEGKQVFARNYDNTATLVSANSKEIGDDTETMYHRAETYRVDIEKEWKDSNDYEHVRPSKIILTLKSNYVTKDENGDDIVKNNAVVDENGNPPTLEIVPDENGNWKGSFGFLPKYFVETDDADYENPNTWHEIKYTIEEEAIYDPADDTSVIYDTDYSELSDIGNVLTVKVTNTHVPRVGALNIRKYIGVFELSEDATFVFDVVATKGKDVNGDPVVVYTNVAVLTISKENPSGSLSTILENIPAGALVTVTEVYTGSHYILKSDPEKTATIVADDTVSVDFTNDYSYEEKGGHGAANIFDPDDSDLGWKWTRAYSTKLEDQTLPDAEED
ncbi:MAG: Cna B-type domain-containing protein [Firmicutes bacterium]|nr:Cna B-type domain-containing protein [Bacillota bacterium]